VLEHELRWDTDDRPKLVHNAQQYQRRQLTLDDSSLSLFKGILSVAAHAAYYGVYVFRCYSPEPRRRRIRKKLELVTACLGTLNHVLSAATAPVLQYFHGVG
jgi:hypothetical protein